jgi:hypothetical protein
VGLLGLLGVRGSPGKEPTDRTMQRFLDQVVDKVDDDDGDKVFLSAILSGLRYDPKQFANLLIAKPNATYGNYFTATVDLLQSEWGTRMAMAFVERAARYGVDVQAGTQAPSLSPIAVVAKFKALLATFNEMVRQGRVSPDDQRRVRDAAAAVAADLRLIEQKLTKVKPAGVKLAGGAAVAAGALWKTAAVLAADDVTGVGVADDIAIPFVVVGAVVLSAIALLPGRVPPEILDYQLAEATAKAAVLLMQQVVSRPVPIVPPMPPPDLGKKQETPKEPQKEPPIQVGPRIKPQPVEPPKRDKERACRDVCGASLPIVWPAELPLPGDRGLERVSRSDDDWFSPRRGSDQALLADQIRRAREQTKAGVPTPPPKPCFTDDADPYELYHAHHRRPLFLGGWEDTTNLCALKDARHQSGHRLLTNQFLMFMTDSTWRSCRMCSSILTKHGVGQQYEIDPSPWPF